MSEFRQPTLPIEVVVTKKKHSTTVAVKKKTKMKDLTTDDLRFIHRMFYGVTTRLRAIEIENKISNDINKKNN